MALRDRQLIRVSSVRPWQGLPAVVAVGLAAGFFARYRQLSH